MLLLDLHLRVGALHVRALVNLGTAERGGEEAHLAFLEPVQVRVLEEGFQQGIDKDALVELFDGGLDGGGTADLIEDGLLLAGGEGRWSDAHGVWGG